MYILKIIMSIVARTLNHMMRPRVNLINIQSIAKTNINRHINGVNIESLTGSKFKPRLFDVSLRDGLQPIKRIYTLDEKKELLDTIITKYNPESIEIGSVVNPKIVPQMANSLKLYEYVIEHGLDKDRNIYILTPTLKSLLESKIYGVRNFSFISSVSNTFQLKNMKRSLSETKCEINQMFDKITNNDNVKLYLSCVNECPISGIQTNEHIINEFMHYYVRYRHHLTDICISDTCGTLSYHDFKYIIKELVTKYGVLPEDISIHLHLSTQPEDVINLKRILWWMSHYDIKKIDISCMNGSGGCHVTLDESKMKANLSYDILNSIDID